MRRASGGVSTTTVAAVARLTVSLLVLEALSCGGDGGGGGGGGGGGTIALSYRTSLTAAQQAAFEAAKDRLQKVITGGLTSVRVANKTCDDQSASPPVIDQTVDGLLILVNVRDLGDAGILAQSGPCLVRSTTRLPIVSVMNLNSVNLTNLSDASLRKTVLHEMAHALGFGTVWDARARAPLSPLLQAHTFTGAQALSAAVAANGAPGSWTAVPVEDCVSTPTGVCGSGTLDSHWRWSVFGNELMTGWIASGAQPLSTTTIASLEDLGYSVDLTQADAFTIPSASALRALASEPPPVDLGDDVLHVRPLEVDGSSP